MKKTTIRSLTIGSIALTAATAGAWFVLTSEPAKNEMSSPVSSTSPPTSAPKRQGSNMVPVPDQTSIPSAQPTAPSATATDPMDIRLGDIQERDNEEGQEETLEAEGTVPAEVVEKTENNNSEQTTSDNKPTSVAQAETNDSTPPDLSGDQESASDRAEELPDHATITSSFPTGEEEQVQNVVPPPQQQEEKTISGPRCKEVTPILSTFVNQFEKKQESKEENRPQSLQEYFNALTAQLLNNPPVVVHETNDLYTVLTNTAHFFRVLGKDNMHLLQKVLHQESADFENIAAEMYHLSTEEKKCVSGKQRLEIPFPALYEYAGFFLNTLGGRSYLFRRDPATRLLVTYYSVLILDQANKRQLNSYGLDIREQLPWLIQEMEATNRLHQRGKYLDKLYELAEKYQALP